jgi:UTP:GlnB (protein PII) uridylyltransferase
MRRRRRVFTLSTAMVRASVSTTEASAFYASMPERYRSTFDGIDAGEHGAIVGRRKGAVAHIEIWRRLAHGGAVFCVVADDRPGLLSFIGASLVVNELDVDSAQIYTRVVPQSGKPEAVDLLWVQRSASAPRPVLQGDVDRVVHVLGDLVLGDATLESVVSRARPARPPPPGASTRVTFDETPEEELAVLTVETFDRPGLLLAIAQALFRANVQIIASDAMTRNGRVVDRFTITELDGSAIVARRRGVVQMEVLGAIEALGRGLR